MKASELLRNALKLVATPKQWTKGIDHDKLGDGTDCYCASGALSEARGRDEWDAYNMAREHLARVIPSAATLRSIAGYNDSARSHDTIVRWFKRAIARAKKLEGK